VVRPQLSWLALPLFVIAGLVLGGILRIGTYHAQSDLVLLLTLGLGSVPLFIESARSILRGHFGIDIIAVVAIVSSLVLHQYVAGSVILLMLSGGEALEVYALRRARRELKHLVDQAPRFAHRQQGSDIDDVSVDVLVPGDTVLVKPGEAVPVDGQVISGRAMVDESKLTGEAMPVEKSQGSQVMSGSVCNDGVLTIRVVKTSGDSKYQQIIRLVREAEEQKAPFVRLADRFSVWFTIVSFSLAGLAWYLSGDPQRVLAVLVVATPCPLILATPIAFASGISRAAKRGIIVKNGGALEKLGTARCFVFDKTGTLTLGIPSLLRIESSGTMSESELLSLAASLDQLSAHILARALVRHAREKGVALVLPENFTESFGDGVHGTIGGLRYALGRLSFLERSGVRIPSEISATHDAARARGEITVYLADNKEIIGVLFFSDVVRDDVKDLFHRLSSLGIEKVVMLTGDKAAVAHKLGEKVGIPAENIQAECLPEDKVRAVRNLRATHAPVVMVGDGVNDAPAIAAADVGVALGAHGSTASSEAGDVVIMLERIDRVGEALCIGHNVLRIALQSIGIGIGLSLILMVIAAFGYIVPVAGALLQEIIDIIVILNALRVLFVSCALPQGHCCS
jgi:heavy metal translocating P-type ATPase